MLCCSDARVLPTAIFDAGVGELFVVRVAGNTLTAEARASLDYAINSLGVGLIVVLGHTECGAVGAACAGVEDRDLAPILAPIAARLEPGETASVNDLVERNVAAVVAEIAESPSAIGLAARAGTATVIGAIYDLATDLVTQLTP